MTRLPEVPMNFTRFFFFFSCFIILTSWGKEKREDEERHFHSTQRKVGLKEVKWIALDHFSFWDFLVSVNNHQSACTSHTCKHTPLCTAPRHSALRGAEFMSVVGAGCLRSRRTLRASCHLKRLTTQIMHAIPSWFCETSVCCIKLNLFGVLFHLLRFHIYKIQVASPSHRRLSNETTHFPAFELQNLSWTSSSAHFTEEKICVCLILSNDQVE